MDETTRVLRIAPVMTGGTSLAVWMGGATFELYRMLRASDPSAPSDRADDDVTTRIHRRLLELTRTRVEVDVLTGTSAGGLNASLLAVAVHHRTPVRDFLTIRDTWQNTADLDLLLRGTDEPDPPSLLRGKLFENEVRAVLERLAHAGRRAATAPVSSAGSGRVDRSSATGVDLLVTVTTLEPVDVLRHDSAGVAVHEVEFAQHLSFRGEQFDEDGWAHRMAVAARTSAGIPGVFEPSRLAIGDDPVDFGDHASFDRSRWAVDGGVVVNLPLTEALDRIYEREADDEVRRIALFVTPTPRTGPIDASHDPERMPSMLQALSSVLTAPRAEGISRELDRIEEQNRRVRNQAELRAILGGFVGRSDLTASQFEAYRTRRSRASLEGLVDHWIESNPGAVRPGDRDRIVADLLPVRLAIQPDESDRFSRSGGRSWEWGIRPVEHMVATGISLLARIVAVLDRGETDESRRALLDAKTRLHRLRRRVESVRRIERAFWSRRLADHPEPPGRDELRRWYDRWPFADDEDLRRAAGELELLAEPIGEGSTAGRVPDGLESARSFVFEKLRGAFFHTAHVLHGVGPIGESALTTIIETDGGTGTGPIEEWWSRRVRRADELRQELRSLVGDRSVLEVRLQILELHFLQVLLLGEVIEKEQHVDLMVLSSDADNALDPTRRGADKLAGPELARLGAFLKPSWRANDWMWGRLDAVDRLIGLLLDPDEVRRFDPTGDRLTAIVEEFVGSVPDAVAAEVTALAAGDDLRALPETTSALGGVIQRSIAREELPRVAAAIDESVRRGGVEGDGGRFRRSFPIDPATTRSRRNPVRPARLDEDRVDDEQLDALFGRLRIGDETVGDELGHRMAARTAATAGSVAVNAVFGARSGLPVPALATPLRAIVQGVAAVVDRLTRTDPVSRVTAGLVLAVASAIIALSFTGAAVPRAPMAVSVGVLGVIFAWSLLRQGRLFTAGFHLIGGAVVTASILGSDLARVLYDSPPESAGTGEVVTASWKTWVFSGPVPLAPVLIGSAAVLALIRNLRWDRFARAFGAGAVAVFAVVLPWLSRAVLTGDPGTSKVKDSAVEFAETIHPWRFPVVLLVLATGAIVFGLGLDTLLTRPLAHRRARRRAERAERSRPTESG